MSVAFARFRKFLPNDAAGSLTIIFLGACLTWSVLSPLGTIPDEPAHVRYAASAVRGNFGVSQDWGVVKLEKSIVSADVKSCTAFNPQIEAACQPRLSRSDKKTSTMLGSAGYPPAYYFVVGIPTMFGFTETTWYLMRLISTLLSTALLGFTLKAFSRQLGRWQILGVSLALTPMVSFLCASVNPNGLEIVSGICLVLSGSLLAKQGCDPNEGAHTKRAAFLLSLVVLSLIRPYSWIVSLGLLSLLLFTFRKDLSSYISNLVSKFVIGAALLSGICYSVWFRIQYSRAPHSNKISVGPEPLESLFKLLPNLDDFWRDSIGLFGWVDYRGFELLTQAWIFSILGVITIAILVATKRQRLGLLALTSAGVIISPWFIYTFLFTDAYGYQVRYAMAILAAVPVLASSLISHSEKYKIPNKTLKIFIWMISMVFMTDWLRTIVRYSVGLPISPSDLGLHMLNVNWVPPFTYLILIFGVVSFVYGQLGLSKLSINKANSQSTISNLS